MPPAIRIENLGKRYMVDHEARQRGGYRTLRESLVDLAKAPLRRLRREGQPTHEEFWALKDVSFEVQPGEVVGIIGRNGAGKSTLLKILSQITKPTTGRVELNGRVGSLLEVGTGFHPELTGRENIYLNGSILGMKKAEIDRKFDEIVAFAEIEQFLDTPVKRYSSGMYVRLAFAVAAHLEPEILIIDEVLAVGDAQFQRKCLQRISTIAHEGKTVIIVSHQTNSLQRLCRDAILMTKGALTFHGSVADCISRYMDQVESLATGAWRTLDDGCARKPRNAAWFDAVRILGAPDSREASIHPDGEFHCQVRIRSTDAIGSGCLSLSIYDRFGTKLVNVASSALGAPVALHSGLNIFTVRVKSLHLKPGTYVLGLWLADGQSVLDHRDSAVFLEVVNKSKNGHEMHLDGGDGLVTCDFSFQNAVN